jgi:hypothetical protein
MQISRRSRAAAADSLALIFGILRSSSGRKMRCVKIVRRTGGGIFLPAGFFPHRLRVSRTTNRWTI